jgi:hypothetical protein
MKNLNDELVKLLKETNFFEYMINVIERRLYTHIFRDAYDDKLSLKEHIERIEDAEKQHTVLITTRLSYDGFKLFFTKYANDFLEEKTNKRVKIINLKESKNPDLNKISFDVIISVDGVEIPYEIKVTQAENKWTGATHSTSKSLHYILIALEVDINAKVDSVNKIIKKGFMLIDNFSKDNWVGEPKKDSSFTTMGLPLDRNFENSIVYGSLYKAKKAKIYYSVQMKEIN